MKINEFYYHLKGKDDFVTKRHAHRELELIHVIHGEGSVLKSDAFYELKSGHLYFIDARKPHIVHPVNCDEYVRSKLVIDAESFFAFCKDLDLTEAEALFSLPPISTENAPEIDKLYSLAVSLCSSNKVGDLAYAKGYVLAILHFASRAEDPPAFAEDAFLKEVLSSIAKGSRSLEDIAHELSYNKYYLCHRFKQKTGLTLTEYLSEKRYGQALSLLADKETSIESIAAQLGFAYAPSFTRFFKKKSGLSPQEYRRKKTRQ